MKRLVFPIVLVVATFSTIYGQNSTILEKINAIKSQVDVYYWSEYSHIIPDTAVVNACRWVLLDINDGRSERLSLEAVLPRMKHISMQRGNVTRVFAYIAKVDVDDNRAPSYANTPQTSDHTPTSSPIVPQPVMPSAPTVSSAPAQASRSFVPDMFVQRIMGIKKFQNVVVFLKEQKAQGRILQYGALKDVEDYSSLDLILFDLHSQEVLTLLSATTQGDSRINLTTGTVDSLDNYPEDMVAVIWYIK